jgi:hypothetical protein
MRRLTFSVLIFLIAPALFAAGWKKAYFGATPPGSWARYSDTAPEMKMTTTMTRLADDGGSARVELLITFANDQYPPVRNSYTLRKGFALDRRLIDYMSGVAAGSIVSGDADPTVLDETTIAAIVKNSAAYEPSATFKGTESVGGKQADRYGYVLHHDGDPATIETGDLWLSDAVPFGIVKQTSVTKDANGKVTTSYERTLIESGAKK